MSVEQAKKFVVRMRDDARFRDSVVALRGEPGELKKKLRAEGYEFTRAEVEKAVREAGMAPSSFYGVSLEDFEEPLF
jgi:predicted ribosomally synthesized peptide with nif11-like leader